MSLLLVTVGVLVAGLLGLLSWSTFKKARGRRPGGLETESICLSCKHVQNLLQIRQALGQADLEYLTAKANRKIVRTVLQERRRIALKYLSGLREDFEQLMTAAQIVASLSPEVEAKEEWKRFRLGLEFKFKYELARTKFAIGAPSFPGVQGLAQMVSSLAMDLERTVTEIGIGVMSPNSTVSAQG